MSLLSQPYFHDEEAAFAFLESAVWPSGPVCPHCGCMGRIGKIRANPEKRVRVGLHSCGDCGKQFTVKIGTVFEHARIPLHKMLQAAHLLCSSKKGISAHRLHRILKVQYKTAGFLAHRLCEAMRSGVLAPMGGADGSVQTDETYLGRTARVTVQEAERLCLKCSMVDDLSSKKLMPIGRVSIARKRRDNGRS